jgi:chromosome segregation ATPase
MAVDETMIKAQEILLAQLQKQSDKLTAEIKSKESGLKDLRETVRLTESDCKAKIQAAKDNYFIEKSALEAAIAPLKGLKQECEAKRAELVALSQDKLNAISEVKAAKSTEIREADAVLAKKAAKLSAIETAIQVCKEKVASL